MQVRFQGFCFSTECSAITIDQYVNHMIENNGAYFQIGDHGRFVFFNATYSKEYYVGLAVTVKDRKTYCELIEASERLVVKVNELNQNSRLMDFNFFVLNKVTGMGMYQYYHQSFSLNSFGYFNAQRFMELKEILVNKELTANALSATKERTVRKKYKGRLNYEMLVKKESIKQLIEELEQVKSFEYCFFSLSATEPEFKPLASHVKKERTRLSFHVKSPVKTLAAHIANIVNAHGINNGKVVGSDAEGVEKVLRILDNPDNFGEYGYDEITSKIQALDINQFENSWVIQELLAKCAEHKHIFEIKSK